MSSAGDRPRDQGPISHLNNAWAGEIRLLEAILSAVGVPSIVEIANAIQSLPRDERFTKAYKAYEEILDIDDIKETEMSDLPDQFLEALPEENAEASLPTLMLFLGQKMKDYQESVIDKPLNDTEFKRQYLIFLSYLTALIERIDEMYHRIQENDFEDRDGLLSEILALNNYLFLITTGRMKKLNEEFIRDVFYADYYKQKRIGGDANVDPEQQGLEDMMRDLEVRGAAIVYESRELTISRGAQLAGQSIREFESSLEENGISPKYGPDSIDDLESGPELSK